MEYASFTAGDIIISQGEDGDTAFVITKGSVEVIVGEGAKAKVVATLNKGDVFGEMSLLAPGPRSATIKATTDTECTVTSYDAFMTSIRENPETAIAFMSTLVQRLRKMNDMLSALDAKRGLMGVLFDYISSAELDDPTISQEERDRRRAVYDMPMLW